MKLKELHREFAELKNKLFGTDKFVVLDEQSKDVKRYNLLLQFFYPQYMTMASRNELINQINKG